MRACSKVLILAFLAAPAFGQAPTTFQRVFSSKVATLPSQAFTSDPLNNIGQFGHQVQLTLKNNGGNTCNPATSQAYAELLASFDNVNYTPIGNPAKAQVATTGGAPLSAVLTASGLYSYYRVRLTMTGITPSNCAADVWYSATANGVPSTSQVVTSQQLTIAQNNNNPLAVEKGYRQLLADEETAGNQATLTFTNGGGTYTATVVDCLTVSAQVTTTLVASEYTTVKLTQTGGPTTSWEMAVGFPNGTVAGTSSTHTICGLGALVIGSGNVTISFTSALAHVTEILSASVYRMNN